MARKHDADTFITLCAPCEGMVYRHCLTLLKNPSDAQDAAQEAMLRAFRAFARFDGRSDIGTWLYRIAHNVCLDWLKRPRVKRESASLDALRSDGFDPGEQAPGPEERYLAQSERERVLAAIGRLPEEQRALLSLRYGEDMSYEDLADTLGLSLGTVKSRISRARERLRSFLEE